MQVSKHQPRHRSATLDPFNDPSNISYSSYGVPTLSRNAPIHSRSPPPPPPKPKASSRPRTQRTYTPSAPRRDNNIMEAVQDVVTVRGNTDHGPRTRLGRSQTELPPPTQSRPVMPPVSKRSHSQDSTTMDKAKKNGKTKGNSNADVIDMLDYSGVGSTRFHHDGPFDACAPFRNLHRTKAPVAAWSVGPQADKEALATAQPVQPTSPDVFIPYKPRDTFDAMAEAWGVHEPEPFEDFASAGTGPVSRGNDEEQRGYTKGKRTAKSRIRDDEGNNTDIITPRRPPRSNAPPPKPIFPPDELSPSPSSPTSPTSVETPKRNKSIMQRIRKMREPRAPYDDDERRDASPGENFRLINHPPPDRSQASFVGRFGRPTTAATTPSDEAFVYVHHVPMQTEKSLPTPPKSVSPQEYHSEEKGGYFDGAEPAASGGAGLGRKTSLLKKVGDVVKGRSSK